MAACSKCGKSVGCGCNLKGTLCATCNAAKQKEALELNSQTPTTPVNSEINTWSFIKK